MVSLDKKRPRRRVQITEERARELATMPYQDYLRTPEWNRRRQVLMKYADYRCQVCNAERVRFNVHHRTYERRGHEAMADLLLLCSECHDLFHRFGKLA